MNPFDPFDRAVFQAETDNLRREIAERREKRLVGLEPTWHVPPPEPAGARQRASNGPQAHAEWAAHCRQHTDGAVAGLRRELKARQDRKLAAMAEAMGRVLAEERARSREELDALRAEIATLKASDEHVIDMRGVFGSKRDAA